MLAARVTRTEMNRHPEFGSDIFVPDDVITLPSRDGVNDWFKIQGKWTKKSDVVTLTEVLRFAGRRPTTTPLTC